jgi:hypothetical protein
VSFAFSLPRHARSFGAKSTRTCITACTQRSSAGAQRGIPRRPGVPHPPSPRVSLRTSRPTSPETPSPQKLTDVLTSAALHSRFGRPSARTASTHSPGVRHACRNRTKNATYGTVETGEPRPRGGHTAPECREREKGRQIESENPCRRHRDSAQQASRRACFHSPRLCGTVCA